MDNSIHYIHTFPRRLGLNYVPIHELSDQLGPLPIKRCSMDVNSKTVNVVIKGITNLQHYTTNTFYIRCNSSMKGETYS